MDLGHGLIHLNNAGLCPVPKPTVRAVSDFMLDYSRRGYAMLDDFVGAYESARRTIASFVGAEPDYTAHFPTCSAAISQVAFGLKFKPGDEILIWDQEYPSNAYPWHTAARRSGARVILAPSESDYGVRQGRLLERIGPRTRVVAISWVQSRTGAMTELQPIVRAARKVGAWVVVDVIQGLGIIPFNMAESDVDAVCGASQKWLCSPPGHGFLALKAGRQLELEPLMQGAFTYGMPYDPVDPFKTPRSDAHRFEPGCPLILGAVGTAASMQLLTECGVDALNRQAQKVATRLLAVVNNHGADVLANDAGQDGKSPILTFRPRGGAQALSASLKKVGVTHAIRELEDSIRLSPHGFNLESEADAVEEAFKLAGRA
ncbi:MAG TPA: aminotransferase class V-fold PLP-dependent enzyme, partial [Bdellovibrionota bacterium]|nr:aminotransferase class V-fold PLP-dependent enzyme [Bdellovibrionota bacterium]